VKTSALETILLPEDISNQVSVFCLSCKQRLGSVSYVDRRSGDGSTYVAVSVAIQSDLLNDFRQGPEQVILECSCGERSIYHLL